MFALILVGMSGGYGSEGHGIAIDELLCTTVLIVMGLLKSHETAARIWDGKKLLLANILKYESEEIQMAITFKEVKQYISRIVRVSICFENGSYDNYTLISDIPEGKYEDLFVYGIGMTDVEFPLDVYSKPYAKQPVKNADIFLGCGLEIVLYDKPRTDIVRSCEEELRFGDLRNYIQIGGNFSIVLREDWSSEEYEWRKDIPETYNEMFVYGIGIEVNPKEVDRFKNLDTALARRMVIVLSKTPRLDI